VGADGEVAAETSWSLTRDVGVLAPDDELADQLDALTGSEAPSGRSGRAIRRH
jgi:hypothetical protein